MPQYPTDKFTNIRRSIIAFLFAADLGGVQVTDAKDMRVSSDAVKPFVRVSVRDLPALPTGPGRVTGSTSTKRTVQVVCECYKPDNTNGQATPVDAADALASLVGSALYKQNIQILDYDNAATATGTYLQFHRPPEYPEMPAIKGWYRSTTRIQANWFAEQT